MKKALLSAIFLSGVAMAQTGKVGINTDNPTETLQVQGTTRITEIPINGSTNSIFTKPDGNASGSKDQTFTAVNTLVVDKNGVVGAIAGLPDTESKEVKSIKYVTKTVPINASTPDASVVRLGNLEVRFDGTSPTAREESLSFRLVNKITDVNGREAFADNVIANQLKIGSGGIFGGQDTFISAMKGEWKQMTRQKPNIANNDFVQYNIALINTKEVYRLTVTVNKALSGAVSSVAQVTLFLERLTDQ